jgi:hypothetical protein
MGLITAEIVAPDTSHWVQWVDGALSADYARRGPARDFHTRLLEAGKIPLLSFHHIQELLCIDDAARAHARIEFIQSLPMIAWMRFPEEPTGVGAITDVLAAEAVAAGAGCLSLEGVRDYVRRLLMRTGPAIDALGPENWVWEVARHEMIAGRPLAKTIAALSAFLPFDDSQTLGQVALQMKRSPEGAMRKIRAMHTEVVDQAVTADPKRGLSEAHAMASSFISDVLEMLPTRDLSTRELIVSVYVAQGLDPDEIRDDCRLCDLSELATFRTQLRIVGSKIDMAPARVNSIRMEQLPSRTIIRALRKHGQQRAIRPGSNVIDEHLAILAAYADVLFVDKRTHEDFRRALKSEASLAQVIGRIAKAPHYTGLLS